MAHLLHQVSPELRGITLEAEMASLVTLVTLFNPPPQVSPELRAITLEARMSATAAGQVRRQLVCLCFRKAEGEEQMGVSIVGETLQMDGGEGHSDVDPS